MELRSCGPHTCLIATNTLTTTHIHDNVTDICTFFTRLTSNDSSREREFRDQTAITTKSFFGIQHTLDGDITRSPLIYLASTYTHLKDTKRHKYIYISIKAFLRSLVIYVYGYDQLCNQIPYEKCLTFDRALHSKYIRDTQYTVNQPTHTTFLSRNHYGLHIPSMFLTQLQGRTRELDVRLNSLDSTQHTPKMARLSTMSPHPKQHRNLLRDAIISLAQFGLHFRDTDEPIITISLQQLLHNTYNCTVLGQSLPTTCTSSSSSFIITGNRTGYLPFAHKQDLHLWLEDMIPLYSVNQHHHHLFAPSLLIYELSELISTID